MPDPRDEREARDDRRTLLAGLREVADAEPRHEARGPEAPDALAELLRILGIHHEEQHHTRRDGEPERDERVQESPLPAKHGATLRDRRPMIAPAMHALLRPIPASAADALAAVRPDP